MCNKQFKFKSQMLEHVVTHDDRKVYKCDICLVEFKRLNALVSHKSRHKNPKIYQCSFCVRTFGSKFNKDRHEKSH